MKILVFTSLFPNNIWPNHGIFIQQRIMHGIRVSSWDVKVVAPIPYYPPGLGGWRAKFRDVVKKSLVRSVEVSHPRYLMIPKIGMIFQGFFLFVSMISCMKKLYKSFRYDLIDAHYLYPDGFCAVLLGKIFGCPVVVSARGSDLNVFKDFRIIRRLITWTLKNADSVIVVSDALKRSAVALGISDQKIRVIPNGVDSEIFFPISQEKAKMKLGIDPARQNILLSVCHLSANKGVDILIEGLALLSERNSSLPWYLLIAGDGVERSSLEQLVKKLKLGSQVHFLGAVPHEQLCWVYNVANVVCLLSEREGWPNVVLEALACGKPVMATHVGGIPEILTSPKVGLFVDRQPLKVSEGLQVALRTTWSQQDILEHAKQFQWEHTAEAVNQVFEEVLRPHSSGSRDSVVFS